MNAACGQTVTLINPCHVLQADDPFTTGVVYMPIGLATFAATMRASGFTVNLIDAFGENPRQCATQGKFMILGLSTGELVARIAPDSKAVFIFAINITYHMSIVEIIRAIKQRYPALAVIVLENTQAVTAYSIRHAAAELFEAGADYAVCGEPERRALRLMRCLTEQRRIEDKDGIIHRRDDPDASPLAEAFIDNLDELPFAAWDMFPVENYWRLKYAHGPFTSDKYLPIQTSRGCPYKCRFCVIPQTNRHRWRARSAKSVVDEIEHLHNTLGVSEFHIEDLNPTVNERRIIEFCNELMARGLRVRWKICAGTKIETIKSPDTLELMARAGCDYISISPESGSARLMKLIDKPFDIEHAIAMIKRMRQLGIASQACFVLGFPGETEADRELTRQMVRRLVVAGVDEIAQFIVTPVPGSAIASELEGYSNYSELHFSPTWRQDYAGLNAFRVSLYRDFLLWKLRFNTLALLAQPFRFLSRRFRTKMEMVPYRALRTKMLRCKQRS